MSEYRLPWAYPWDDVAASPAGQLAKRLGHAAAVIVRGRGEYTSVDSWLPVPDGWEVAWLVSVTGKVVSAT